MLCGNIEEIFEELKCELEVCFEIVGVEVLEICLMYLVYVIEIVYVML